jgi:pantoate--beta-alanine ligase
MDVIREPSALRRACDAARARGQRVGLVPTMGALHAGHMALVAHARRAADHVVVSIFVNPTQFGPNEDLARYPRQLEADCALCEQAGVAAVFAPATAAMYPPGEETRVRVGATAAPLCGAFRAVHFEGVATVVTKLFALVGPSLAVFGRKDYQQWRVIERLVTDLFLPIELVGAPIVREADGLALSSRNAYLSASDRRRALGLSRGLRAAARAFASGERDAAALAAAARVVIEPNVDRIDYIELADPENVAPLTGPVGERALLAVAAHVGATRLIDNIVLGEDHPPDGEAHDG